MTLTIELTPEVEQQLREQAARKGMDVKHYAETLLDNKLDMLTVLTQAFTLTQPLLKDAAQQNVRVESYLLTLIRSMTALANPPSMSPSSDSGDYQQSLLNNAIRLYDLRIVSLGTAAQLAGVSQAEFIDALAKAGVSVFQYGAEEILAEAEAA
jgi:predicted HTH domain antitoxin